VGIGEKVNILTINFESQPRFTNLSVYAATNLYFHGLFTL